jgi:hypothetical protein
MRSKTTFFLAITAAQAGGCSEYKVSMIPADVAGGMDTGVDEISELPPTEDPPDVPAEPEDDCVEDSTAFDIEEISGLQDAFGLPDVRDGLTLSVTADHVEGDKRWRPTEVEVLVSYPAWYYDFYDDSNSLTVSFYASGTPTGARYSKTVPIRKDGMDWAPLTLPAEADWSGGDREQMAAWLKFDLDSVVPDDGFRTTDYFVALEWDGMGFPYVGYSNFNLDCTKNWTDYGTGSYVQNSGTDCSWPMLKIEIETISPGDCE